ncbi:unnamed protein product [Didymodactylos carnosus]|uniref:Uncharacterized protein n=1 Tax=Didymodactylos carnosus TaxID=1234261 RepID=A0A813XU34_9BILA|nr:unnamed protein product [Didymodactylos carnosus]CAF3659165.1 unnamed protein product [Didymodactylos carnosus]
MGFSNGSFRTIHRYLSNYQVIIYDLGLTDEQVDMDALKQFGSIIYGDTSIRYLTNNFDRLLIDNNFRGFACRELPGHYLPCFTLSNMFLWFNESSSTFDNVYMCEANFLFIQDNFLSRLIMKAWITCSLDLTCLMPPELIVSQELTTKCDKFQMFDTAIRHRYDQSAMGIILTFFFQQGERMFGKNDPAPYDMYTSIQDSIIERV